MVWYNTRGCSIIAIGEGAAFANTLANGNIAIGLSALHNNTTLAENLAIGLFALENQNYAASCPTGVGCTSTHNVAIGSAALHDNNPNSATTGRDNTAVGYRSGFLNVTGRDNSFLGFEADVTTTGLNNVTVLGANADATTSNTMILGTNAVNVGIGFSGVAGGPLAKLDLSRTLSTPQIANPIGIRIINADIDAGGISTGKAYGITSEARGVNWKNYGGLFIAENAATNIGGFFSTADPISGTSNVTNTGIEIASGGATTNYGLLSKTSLGTTSFAGRFEVKDAVTNYGVSAFATSGTATTTNFGVWGYATVGTSTATTFNVGVYGEAAVNAPLGANPPAGIGTWQAILKGM